MKKQIIIGFVLVIATVFLIKWGIGRHDKLYSEYNQNLDSSIKNEMLNTQQKIDSMKNALMNPKKAIQVRDLVTLKTFTDIELKKELLFFYDYQYPISTYTQDIHSILSGVAEFYKWADIFNNAKSSTDTSLKNNAVRLTGKLIKMQLVNFPVLRKSYAKIIDKNLWDQDFDSATNGKDQKTVWFIHSSFYTNKNIKSFQSDVEGNLVDLRFKKAKYTTSKYSDDIETLQLESYSDSSIAYFVK